MAITMVCDTGVALLFYNLFKPVNKDLSLLAAAFRLILVVVMTVNSLNYFRSPGFIQGRALVGRFQYRLRLRFGAFRNPLPLDGLPHFPLKLSS
jgi:hypothetical protein